jgi:tetratricopeptide (TPR) repeat protein
MHRYLLLALLALEALVLGAPCVSAQSALLDLPRESQRAKVSQRVGITDITITYHRPLVKGRKVWGGLVPYGEPWRAGANENTLFQVSDPVTVEGQPLAKGTYGLHMIPGENEWIIAFSKTSTAWGSFSYDKAEDALRVTVKPKPSDFHEALTYDFDEVTPNSTTAVLRWEKLAVPFKIEVNTLDVVQRSLPVQLRGIQQYTWEAWEEAATYILDHKGNLENALKDANNSIQVEERFENLMTKARILDGLARKEEAAAARNKAMEMGSALQLHSYGRQLQIQKEQEKAFEIYRINIRKNPSHWTALSELSRIACAKGDFDTAVKEMKLSVAAAPDQIKAPLTAIVKRLENKEDINK